MNPCNPITKMINRHRLFSLAVSIIALVIILQPVGVLGKEKQDVPKAASIPSFRPNSKPVAPGEFPVGVITISFKDTAISGSLDDVFSKMSRTSGAVDESGSHSKKQEYAEPISLAEYFKIYSNNLSWPKLQMMPNNSSAYEDPNFYGYFCEYDYWENPMGWKTSAEGAKRVEKMNKDASNFAKKSFAGDSPRFICYNYITTRSTDPTDELTAELLDLYQNRGDESGRSRRKRARKSREKKDARANDFKPWDFYAPEVKWGEPMWPNSKIQLNNSDSGTLAHELGHCLGAPDVYRVGRFNDGIAGAASLLAYGPTANAFSRFYHHGFIQEKNHPTLKTSGTYTLHPRHIDPKNGESVGFLIPSNHPHYFYHVEYIHDENSVVGVGQKVEGMVISAVNLGLENYLGSPDYFYVYRPNDPFFRGAGDTANCLFGKSHGRTEFNMTTEPSARLPNLLDGGVSIKNIDEHDGTLTFDLEIDRKPVTGSALTQSMLPQIRLDAITDIQPTSFTMDCTIKFRGEPLKTAYGFCWSKSPNPTVKDSTFTLRHREWFRGHAINLVPDTTYYVRAFATNGLGFRYSDEEQMIKTPALKLGVEKIGPLLTDSFSDNQYLYRSYSNETNETAQKFIGYSPTCVLAKLIAYYRPLKFEVVKGESSKTSPVDFNQMSWRPGADDFPMRLEEVDDFFGSVYSQCQELNFQDREIGKDFVKNLIKLTGFRSKPVLNIVDSSNLKQVSELIRKDLALSRPVIIAFYFEKKTEEEPTRWALIDGIDSSGKFHIDFPKGSKIRMGVDQVKVESGNLLPETLLLDFYKVVVVTSCFGSK